ncbi:hypothetical protein ACWGN9_10775 [Streptomyces sp. NPDC055775]
MKITHVVGRILVVLVLALGATALSQGSSLAAPVAPLARLAGAPTAPDEAQAAPYHETYNALNGSLGTHISYAESLRYANSVGYGVAVFYDGLGYNNRTGDTLVIIMPRDCTASTGDKDLRLAEMPGDWNDRVSSVTTQMGNGTHCDVWFSSDINFEGECGNRWIHMQADLRNDGCQNRASSFELS